MRRLLCGLAIAMTLSMGASADEWRLDARITPPDDGQDLASNQMYALEVSCKPGKLPLPRIPQPGFFERLVPSHDKTISHFVYISSGQVTNSIAATTSPGADNLLWMAYAVDTKSKLVWNGIKAACPRRPHLLRGQYDEWAYIGGGSSSTLVPGAIMGIINNAFKAGVGVAEAIGHMPTDMTGKQVSGLEDSTAPLDALVTAFDPDTGHNLGTSLQLGPRTVTITTQFSVIKITIRPVDSLAADTAIEKATGLPYLLDKLKTDASVSSATIGKSQVADDCSGLKSKLMLAGYHDQDQAYGLMYAAAKSNVDRTDLPTCLGTDLIKPALSLSAAVWKTVPMYNQADLGANLPVSGTTQTNMENLMMLLAKYTQTPADRTSLLEQIKPLMSANLTMDTLADCLGADMPKSGLSAILDALANKGYFRYGFFAPTDKDMKRRYEQATLGFLVIHAGAKDASAPASQVVAAYPIFDANNVITKLHVAQVDSEIKKFAATQSGKGFKIDTGN